MIIYIPLEISVRELQGHLLLATVAASRGHQVLIASASDLWLWTRLNRLRKGAFLLKNVNVPSHSQKMYEVFLKGGFDIYCQEQEPSILWDSFEKFLFDYNITCEQYLPFKGVFCWGERDTNGYKQFFTSKKDVFVNIGSPRADLWSPRFAALHTQAEIGKLKPYILMVSNFGLLMGKRHWTEWLIIGKKNETLRSLQQEDRLIDYILEDSSILLHMVKAVRYLAAQYPSYTIVIRPHPLDDVANWKYVAGDYNNIHVASNHGPLSDWISGACLVIQNGCTSALETVLQKVPLISFGPERCQGDTLVPSYMGMKVESLDELDAAIKICLSEVDYASIQEHSESILKPIISTESGDAAFKMVHIIEDRSNFDPSISVSQRDLMAMRLIRVVKNGVDWLRRRLMRVDLPGARYDLDQARITREVHEMARVIKVAPPKLSFISSTGVMIG